MTCVDVVVEAEAAGRERDVAGVVPVGDVDVVVRQQRLAPCRAAAWRNGRTAARRPAPAAARRRCPCGNGAGCRTASAAPPPRSPARPRLPTRTWSMPKGGETCVRPRARSAPRRHEDCSRSPCPKQTGRTRRCRAPSARPRGPETSGGHGSRRPYRASIGNRPSGVVAGSAAFSGSFRTKAFRKGGAARHLDRLADTGKGRS